MPDIIIPDTSVLILFQNINQLSLLRQIYGGMVTTSEITIAQSKANRTHFHHKTTNSEYFSY